MVAKPVRRSEPGKAATHRRLLEAAERVFAEHGYHGATVEAVCQEAAISVATFYRHVANIDELLHVLAEEYQAQVEQHVTALFGADPGPGGDQARLEAARRYVANYRRYEGVARVWGAESDRDEVLRQLSAVSTRRIEASLRRAVRGSDAHSDTALHGAHLALIALVERLPYQLAVPFEVPGFPPSDERLAEVLSAFVGATVGQLAGTSNRRSVDGNSVT